jgi:alanyl-tRNA synthetase
MKAKEVREKYLKFFEDKGHKRIPPAPLVLENDFSTLFTSAGMQPLVPYLVGEPHPQGKRLTNSQPSIRLGDIEEVGDNRHTTFFEMLGNWSLGDYFKREQLHWKWDFFTKELGLDPKRLYATVYRGSKDYGVDKDYDSVEIWKEIYRKDGIKAQDVDYAEEKGMQEGRIFYYEDNWWSMTGKPEAMNIGHIGGPDSEMFFDFGEGLKIHESSEFKDKTCHPNCDCGRFLEIGNSVFIQYKKVSESKLEELKQKNVDFGGGFERITAAVNDTPDIFKTDLFSPIIDKIEKKYAVEYGKDEKIDQSIRVIAEHSRAATALISNGIIPSNKTHGYILRRLIRRSIMYARNISKTGEVALPVVDLSKFGIPIKLKPTKDIEKVLEEETGKFKNVMESGIKKLTLMVKNKQKISGDVAFDLYQSYGFPLELTLEVLEQEGLSFTSGDRKEFEKEFEKHKDQSRTTSAGVFKGGLADHSEEVAKLHTATHLLLATLRKVLGDQIVQKGQNITKERARFDFPHPQKLNDEELKKVEDLINETIKKDLPVNFKILPKDEAIKTGATHAFNEKYADTVKVYYVGSSIDSAFSKEFCGGPHVTSTGMIGRVTITKQEKIGSGLMRIYATLK